MTDSIPPSCRVPAFVGNKQIKFIEQEVPKPGRGQLLLRVGANALCGSERPQFFDGSAVTPGHEAAGVVVAAGLGTYTAVGTTGAVFLMDFCGECRSIPAVNKPRQEGLASVAQRGSLICVGHGEGIAVKISPDIIAPERSIVGSEYFRYNELPANLERLQKHRAYLNEITTHRMPVDQIQPAFEMFFAGETGKVLIEQ